MVIGHPFQRLLKESALLICDHFAKTCLNGRIIFSDLPIKASAYLSYGASFDAILGSSFLTIKHPKVLFLRERTFKKLITCRRMRYLELTEFLQKKAVFKQLA